MDKMRALRYFLEVAETGSFSAAAKSLGVPASSISRRIQKLEAELGATLIHRTTRVVRLTELGALYLERIRPAMAALAEADEVIVEQPHSPSGHLRITAPPGYGGYRLAPALVKLRQQYPELVVDIELTDRVANLDSDDVDLALRVTANPPERTVARKLADNRFVLVASPGYLKRAGVPRVMADLQQHKTLLYRRPDGILHWQAKTTSEWHDLRTVAAFISNMGSMLLDEARAGSGLALLPDWGVVEPIANRQLQQIELEDAKLFISRNANSGIFLLYHRPRYQLKKLQVAVDFLVEELTDKRRA